MNKCDLIKHRADLLKRAHALTCGTIGGTSITLEGPRLGKLGQMTRAAPSSFSLNSMENRMEDKDPKWIEAYK